MPEARRIHVACAIGSIIYVFGGRFGLEGGFGGDKTPAFKLDNETNTWSTLAPMPLPCSHHSVSVLDGDLVYIVGAGNDGKGVLRFDVAPGVWSTLGTTSNDKHGSATFVLGGCLHVAGGKMNSSSVERYNVATDTWTPVSDMLEDRRYLSAVTIGSVKSAEEQNLFDSLIAKAARKAM
jgi:hypothetical protein